LKRVDEWFPLEWTDEEETQASAPARPESAAQPAEMPDPNFSDTTTTNVFDEAWP
jgi:hypothetical protein